MAFGLDDALLSWLVASAGHALVSRLRGDRARRAMRHLVEEAVATTVATVAGHLDSGQAEELRSVLRKPDTQVGRARVASFSELRAAVRLWMDAVDRKDGNESGYLSRLGVDADRLAEELANQIASGIRERGRTGGPLGPLANWLWRDELSTGIVQIKRDLNQYRADFQPPRSTGSGLPGGTPDFTGRHEVLAKLAEQVEAHDPNGIVVAIHAVDGMAGVGKTELALRAAHQHKHRYPDGQYFINLHGYTDGIAPMPAETALEALLRQAGVPGQAIPPDLASRQTRWQAHMVGNRALLLLDNALDVDQVRPLLPMSAGCLVLITSRSWLPGLPGQTLKLDVPTTEEASELFTRVVGTNHDVDPEMVTTIVQTIGCLPVAVRAIAGQMRTNGLTVTDLAANLAMAKHQRRLVEETSPLNTGVRTAFETSLQRLDETDRRAFQILGLHAGTTIGVPQLAALAAVPVGHARTTLSTLAGRNLITPADNRTGHRRYQLHDLMREFAREQAETYLPEERQSATDRLTSWYVAALRLMSRMWDTTSPQPPPEPEVEGLDLKEPAEARAWLAAERDNLVALAGPTTGPDAAQLFTESGWRLYLLDHYAAARTLYQSAADIYQHIDDQHGRAEALLGVGHVALATGDHQEAGRQFSEVLASYRPIPNQGKEGAAVVSPSQMTLGSSDYFAVGGHLRGTLAASRQIENHGGGEAGAQLGLGQVALAQGNYQTAREHFRDALTVYHRLGNRTGEATALFGLGQTALGSGEYLVAGKHFRDALSISQQIESLGGEADCLLGLGQVAQSTGNHPVATQHYTHALANYRQIGDRRGEAGALFGLGQAAQSIEDLPAAGDHYRQALTIDRQIENRRREAEALIGLADVAGAAGDYQAPGAYLREALAICRQTGTRSGEASALDGLGHQAIALGDHPAADKHYREALAICRQIGNRSGEASALDGLGQITVAVGDHPAADKHYREALAICRQIGNRRGEAKSLSALGHLASAERRPDESRQHLREALTIFLQIGSPLAEAVQEALERTGPDRSSAQ